MKTQLTITRDADEIIIDSPFSSVNNDKFRSRGGKFSKGVGWVFPATLATGSMIEELFGAESPIVTVRIALDSPKISGRDCCMLGGYKVACRRGRDYRVDMPDGVVLESGSWCSSGGSVKNPCVTGNDPVLNVNVRRSFAEREGLDIIAADEAGPVNPLAAFSDEQIRAEFIHRNLK